MFKIFNSHGILRNRNLDESIIDEQLNKLLLSRKAHIGTLTKRIIKINRAREISTEHEFRVIQIRKSINHFITEYFPEADLVLVQNPQKAIKNQDQKLFHC